MRLTNSDLRMCAICATTTPNRICKPCLDNKFTSKAEVITEKLIRGTLSVGNESKLVDIDLDGLNDTISLYFLKGESVTLWRAELAFFLRYGYVMKFITTHNDHEKRPYVVVKMCKIEQLLR